MKKFIPIIAAFLGISIVITLLLCIQFDVQYKLTVTLKNSKQQTSCIITASNIDNESGKPDANLFEICSKVMNSIKPEY